MSDGSGYAQAAAAVAVAGIQAAVAKSVADKQYDIARKQQARADKLHSVWESSYLPIELRQMAELAAKPAYVPRYDLIVQRATTDVAVNFSKARAEARRNMSVYGMGAMQALEREIVVAQGLATADAVAAGRRREDGRADMKEQQRVDNIHRAVALGRGMLDQSGSASRLAAQAVEAGGSTIASAMNSGAKLLGYLWNRDPNAGAIRRAVNDMPAPSERDVQDFMDRHATDGYSSVIDGVTPGTPVNGNAVNGNGGLANSQPGSVPSSEDDWSLGEM